VVNAFVGAMIGMERTILPAIAEQEFRLAAKVAVLSFIVVFGVTKALTNYLAGRLSDRYGRKIVLVGGWVVAAPVPFLLMWAPSWTWVLVANALLGVSQGLTWSTTVIMKIDLAGPQKRGLAMGLNEFAGYFAVAASALATGYLAERYGLRPEPFYLGVGFVIIGFLLSAFVVKETLHHVAAESALSAAPAAVLSQREVFWRTSLLDRDLSSVSQAGLVNNLNDGMAWGLFPLFFTAAHMDLSQIGTLAAIYPATWGVMQLFTGAWSDRVGRKWLIASGMWVQAVGIGVVVLAGGFWGFATGAALLGIGTAMVYPTLLAAIGDVAHPTWRASAVGVYRLWRDLGYAFGAVLAGVTADAFGLPAAMWLVAALTFGSGLIVAVRMRETLRRDVAVPTVPSAAAPPCVEPASLSSIPGLLVVDVRSPEEYLIEHVEGAINMPVDVLDERWTELPRDAQIVTACGKGGGRSDRAAERLRALGFASARPLCGGTAAWVDWTARRT
ncbi:MAG: MFS transporter, partial [Myxococcales bacterium]|nr:MFS transporter [Myxococcales bacterium]